MTWNCAKHADCRLLQYLYEVGSLMVWKYEEITHGPTVGKLKYVALPNMVAIVVITASVVSAPA